MNAKNMSELETMLKKEIEKAMRVTSEKVLEDMYDETGKFYTGEQPTMYVRTGALGDTPRTTAISTLGNTISFEAYLDTNHVYDTGKKPTMLDILNLTKSVPERHSSVGYLGGNVRGRTGFWERSLERMERDFDETLRKFFK